MVYQGNKERIADKLVELFSATRAVGQLYWEPFLGSASVFCRMPGPKLGTDAMTDLIMLWKAVISDTFIEPSSITREQYRDLMTSKVPSAIRGYAGFFWSFSGMFNKGYSPEFFQNSRSFYNMQERAKLLRGPKIKIAACDYREPNISNALIYCDPPYRGTTPYKGAPNFDSDAFYLWCKEQKSKGSTIFISEYDMPSDFTLIAEFPFSTSLGTVHREASKPERLYTLL